MNLRKWMAVILSAALTIGACMMTGCDQQEEKTASDVSAEKSSPPPRDAEELSDEDLVRISQLYGSAGCIYLCNKNGIALDASYQKKIKEEADSFLAGLNTKIIGTSDLSKLICVDAVLSLGRKEQLEAELNSRYNKDAKLFDEYANDTYEGLDENQKATMQIASTDAVWIQYNAFGIKSDTYDIQRLLADAFNAHVSQYDHNDIYNGRWSISSELENIFYYFLITDSLDLIQYQKVWDVLGPNYLRDLFETNVNNDSFAENSIANISGILTDIKAKEVLKASITPKYPVQDYYNSLKDADSFQYNESADEFVYYEYELFLDLSQPSDLKLNENAFFRDNVGKWLENCYEKNHKKPGDATKSSS